MARRGAVLAARLLAVLAGAALILGSAYLSHARGAPLAGERAWRGPGRVDARVPAVPILMYHHVGDWGAPHPSWRDWVVKPADFEAQLDWLVEHGYRTITFAELLWSLDRGTPLPPKPVILSFDDGWAEHAHWLSSELATRGMRGVLFVFTGAVAPKRNGGGYISWEELRALEQDGHEVQSHTVSHARLPTLPDDAVVRELVTSRERIQSELGHDARVLAYPFGDFDARVARAAARAGYELAVRADADPAFGPAARMTLPRIRMQYGESVDALARMLSDGFCERSRY